MPFQVGVLGTPSPSVTPTNLLYKVVATPRALYRYRRQRQTGRELTPLLVAGTVPGVIAGAVIRVELLPSADVFDIVIAAMLVPLGLSLLVRGRAPRAKASAITLSSGRLLAVARGHGWLRRRHLRVRRRSDIGASPS